MVFDGDEPAEVLGSTVVDVQPAPWGNKNRTRLLELADGRRVVWQQYRDPGGAAHRLLSMEQFSRARLGVAVPQILASGVRGSAAWAVFENLPGEVAYVLAGHDLSGDAFPAIASDMGKIVAAIRQLDAAQFSLPRLWCDPAELQRAAEEWLRHLSAYLAPSDRRRLEERLRRIPALFSGRPQSVAHGDLGPQNVLVTHGAVTGLLDFEDARLADSLLDTAWWAWLVRAHTPAAFDRSWTAFLQSAHVDPREADFNTRATTLILCRLLETAEQIRLRQPEAYPSWGDRVEAVLDWPNDALCADLA